jgi:hypothetical protein
MQLIVDVVTCESVRIRIEVLGLCCGNNNSLQSNKKIKNIYDCNQGTKMITYQRHNAAICLLHYLFLIVKTNFRVCLIKEVYYIFNI